MAVPAVRARSTRDFIAYLETVDPGRAASVMAQVPENARAALAAASDTDWISIEHSHHWLGGYVTEVGADTARETFARCVQARVGTSPLMREIGAQLATLGRRGPQAIVRFVPHVLVLGYRDFFRARLLEVHDVGAEVLLENVAPEVFRYSEYFVCFEGLLTGALRFSGQSGTVSIAPEGEHSARCAFAWE